MSRAADVLTRHGALEATRRLDETRSERARVTRELAHARGDVPWWERTGAFAPNPALVGPLSAHAEALAAVEGERLALLDAALDAAQAEMPPIEIARRVGRCFELARGAGLGAHRADEELVVALEVLADRVIAIWAPGLSAESAAEQLMDPAAAAAAAASDPADVAPHDVLGWAPATPDRIVARAARLLQRPEIEAARARVARERAEYEQVAARLHELRKGASTWRRLTGDDAQQAFEIDAAAQRARIEEHELTAAWETLLHEVGRALAATPPLHVARAAIAAAGVLRARLTTWEVVIALASDAPGQMVFMGSVSRRARAVMFAALRELKAATEAAFPGLLGLLTPRGAAAAARDEAARGPYRQRPATEPLPEGPRGLDLVATVIERAKAAGLDARVGALVAHGAALGALSRRTQQVSGERGVFEKLGAWVSSEDDPLEARAAWHRALAFSMLDQAEATVATARRGLFALDFRASLAAAAAQVFSMRLVSDRSLFDLTCSLQRHHEAIQALVVAERHFFGVWGEPGDRMQLIGDVAQYIHSGARGPHPFPPGSPPRPLKRHELVVLLGEHLRPTPFLGAVAHVHDANRRWLEASGRASDAAARITFWDRLNFFTDSEAEATQKAQTLLGEATFREGRAAFVQVDGLLEQAFALYPPAAVYYRLEEATTAVRAVSVAKVQVGYGKNKHHECRMFGMPQATAAMSRLATATFHAFGPMLSDTEILAAHWERALDEEPSAQARRP